MAISNHKNLKDPNTSLTTTLLNVNSKRIDNLFHHDKYWNHKLWENILNLVYIGVQLHLRPGRSGNVSGEQGKWGKTLMHNCINFY